MGLNHKKILFVTPDLRYGGTNSSLSNIFSVIKEEYDIDVFSLYNKKIGQYSFGEKVIESDKLLYWYYSYFSDLVGRDKLGAFIMKIFKRLALYLGVNLEGFLQCRMVNKIEKWNKYDMIIAFQEGAATRFVSRFNEVPKIAWIHCDYAHYHSISNRDERLIYQRFNKIVCVSRYTATSFRSVYPLFQNEVKSLYNLFDKERVELLSNEAITDNRFSNDTFSILSVGRIDKVKRYSSIPEIAAKLKLNEKRFKWYIIGNAVDQEEYQALTRNVEKYKVDDIVILLGGKANPYPYFANSNLFVSTSSSEACPMVFIEAQTFSLPIVTTNFGSSYEFIECGENGYISDISCIHESIENVMDGKLENYSNQSIINNKDIVKQVHILFNEVLSES